MLHILAMAFMLCDHLWGTVLGKFELLGYLGRLAFPIFAFLLAEGFAHTGNRKKYAKRLALFALISEIPFNLLMAHTEIYPLHQNVLWAFLLGIGMMSILEKAGRKKHLISRLLLSALTVLGFYLLGILTFVDYYGYGILMIALFYFTRTADADTAGKKWLMRGIQLLGMYWINCEMMKGLVQIFEVFGTTLEITKQGLALLSLIFIWLYDGRQGPYNKTIRQVYYWFYPVHALILGAIVSYL